MKRLRVGRGKWVEESGIMGVNGGALIMAGVYQFW